MDDRQALRDRLKNRILEKKNERYGGGARKPTPQDMLLKLAGDDADVLKLAQQALTRPADVANMMKSIQASTSQSEEEEEDVPESFKESDPSSGHKNFHS